jgi:hypothetical protein
MTGYVEAATTVVNTIGGAIKILEQNRPAVSHNQILSTAMPRDMDPMSAPVQGTNTFERWYVQGWSFAGEPYSSQAKVNISWAWGARYHGGGAFIPSVWAWVDPVQVPEMWVPWYHHLDVTFSGGNPYTQDAGQGQIYSCLPIEIHFLEETPVDRADHTWRYILYGTGHKQQQ